MKNPVDLLNIEKTCMCQNDIKPRTIVNQLTQYLYPPDKKLRHHQWWFSFESWRYVKALAMNKMYKFDAIILIKSTHNGI